MITPEHIQNLVNRFVEAYNPEKMILFGSYAYGTPNEDSDLDVCVLKTDPRHTYNKQLELRKHLTGKSFSLDLLMLQPNELDEYAPFSAIHNDIKERGKVIYDGKRSGS